ncbi:hypothetical protein FO519_008968 [Halicephalobus sp. NKZ332]|nr:hypothetical protein FO519_008968 [Halicephalobus sp. NKZ332]
MENCVPTIFIPEQNESSFDEDEEFLIFEECNSKTKKFCDKKNKRTIYIFDYSGVNLSWKVLNDLRDNTCWDVIKHPYILNYINEILLRYAIAYALYIIVYVIFLLLIYSCFHGDPHISNRIIITVLIAIFVLIWVTKFILKSGRDPSCSRISIQFVITLILTHWNHSVIISFVWKPMWFNYSINDMKFKEEMYRILLMSAIISSWFNFIYTLRKSPFGLYVLMMYQIFRSFTMAIIIWISTLLCFASLFQPVMRNSESGVWKDVILSKNNSVFLTMFQSFTKISAMMTGEVEANSILELREGVASLFLIIFVISAVILLQNLMIAIAVGDVSELRKHSDERMFQIKVNYCIEILQLSDLTKRLFRILFSKRKNNRDIPSKHESKTSTGDIELGSMKNISTVTNMENKKGVTTPLFAQGTNDIAVVNKEKNYISRIHILYGKRINNIAVIYWKRNKMSTGKIDLGSEDTISNDPPGSSLDRVEFLRNENTIVVKNKGSEDIRTKLNDKESYHRKFRQWFIGLKWNPSEKVE